MMEKISLTGCRHLHLFLFPKLISVISQALILHPGWQLPFSRTKRGISGSEPMGLAFTVTMAPLFLTASPA